MSIYRSRLHGTIHLVEKFTKTQRRFTVTDIVSSEGASVICYEAHHEASARGILREFYPSGFGFVTRSADGRMIFDPEDPTEEEEYLRQAEEFLRPYARILEAEKKNARGNIISTFIPYFEIYTASASEEHPGGLYIWTPQPRLCSFDRVIRKIRKAPFREPERNLHFVLQTLLHLTEQVMELHKAGLVHQDLKPSNFGFPDVDSLDPNPQTMIYDINSVTGMLDSHGFLYGTPGFMDTDPLFKISGRPSLQQDIFSIGAILFNAIVITDETEKNAGLYKNEYYPNLRNMVNDSKLIRATENNSYYQLRLCLIRILEKTLGPRRSRYRNCEELRDELYTALCYTKPYSATELLSEMGNWKNEPPFENPVPALQDHLFFHPLYESVHQAGSIHVLIVGLGKYGQRFLDLVLQYGQMKDQRIRVTVISKAETDLEAYFLDRPELRRFVSVNGEKETPFPSFADLIFRAEEIDGTGHAGGPGCWAGRLAEENGAPDYCFVAVGDEAQNQTIAAALSKAGLNAYYAWSRSETPAWCMDGAKAVCMRKDVRKDPDHALIENIAFNVHLSYCDDLLDQDRRLSAFRKDLYDYESSVSCAISLKYKLHSLGIELEKGTADQAARQFEDRIRRDREETVNTLAWLEHRRWVAEKLTQGWSRMTDLKECLYNGTKNTAHKKHACIVPSRPEAGLSRLEPKQWDTLTPEELAQLDELDQLSVRLHQMYVQMADSYSMELLRKQSAELLSLIGDEEKAARLWESLRSCMIRISRNHEQSIRQYKGLRAQLTDELKKLPRQSWEAARSQEELIHVSFLPVLEARKYTDFKKYDRELVRQIPFQLTYSSARIIPVLPFGSSNVQACMRNAMTLLALNPAQAVLVCLHRPSDDFAPELECLRDFVTRKKIRTKLNLLIGCEPGGLSPEQLHDRIGKLLPKGSASVDLFEAADHGTFAETLRTYMACYEGKQTALADNESFTAKVLWDEGFYDRDPMFRIELSGRFTNTERCDYLDFMGQTPPLTAEDIVSLHFVETRYCAETWETGILPEAGLWNTYIHNRKMWDTFCDAVCKHEQEKNRLLSLTRKAAPAGGREKGQVCCFTAPKETADRTKELLAVLQQHGFIEKAELLAVTTGGTSVRIRLDAKKYPDVREAEQRLGRLFTHAGSLYPDYSVRLDPSDTTVEVFRYDPLLEALRMPSEDRPRVSRFLGRLEKNGLIRLIGEDSEGRYSMLFLSREAHDLFTDRTVLFRQYASTHLEAGKALFDDLVRSREMGFTDPALNSMPYHIAVKGPRAWLLFNVPGSEYSPAVYERIRRIARKIGPDMGSILITDAPGGKANMRIADPARADGIETVFVSPRTDFLQEAAASMNRG